MKDDFMIKLLFVLFWLFLTLATRGFSVSVPRRCKSHSLELRCKFLVAQSIKQQTHDALLVVKELNIVLSPVNKVQSYATPGQGLNVSNKHNLLHRNIGSLGRPRVRKGRS